MVNEVEITKIVQDVNADAAKTENFAEKVEIDATKVWDWFEQHIGITHTTQKAAQALNTIVPKPTLAEPVPALGSLFPQDITGLGEPTSTAASGESTSNVKSSLSSGSSNTLSSPQVLSGFSIAGNSTISGSAS